MIKNKMNKYLLFIGVVFHPFFVFAQKDSLSLNIEDFLEIVRQYHPIVKQAKIDVKQTDADILIAKGAFNPILSHIISNKKVGGTNYYESQAPKITIPTWYGIEVTGGIEDLSGVRYDPTRTLGQSSYLGINIPLLKNLLMDKRRAYLNQSKIFNTMAVIEQQLVINTILMEAAAQYWEWVNSYQAYQIIIKSMTINQQRLKFVEKISLNGERPTIDVTEATLQYQNLEFQKNDAWLKFQKESLALSAFMWLSNDKPYILPENIGPQKGWEDDTPIQSFSLDLSELLSNAKQFHPELKMYKQKLDILEIEKTLKFQDLLPKLDLKYTQISKGFNSFNTNGFALKDNYQFGLNLEMPIPFMVGRGEYRKAKLKIEEAQISQNQKVLDIEIKLKSYYNDFLNLKNQIELQKSMLVNLKKLLYGEETMFKNGESSLFLINARENKVLEVEQKLADLKAKYFKTVYALQWSAGLLQ